MRYELISSPWIKKVIPYALTAAAGAGVIGTAVLAAKATLKALEKKAEAEKEKGEELTTWEKFKVMAPSYVPAASAGTATIAAITGIVLDSNAKQAELAAVVTSGNRIIDKISRRHMALREEVKKKDPEVIEEFDKRSLNEQWEAYVKERAKMRGHCWGESMPINDSSEWNERMLFGIEYGNDLTDENGNQIIFFESTPADVVCAFYNLNGLARTNSLPITRVNDLFHLLHLPKTQLGEELVWDPSVMWYEWETDFIHFITEDIPLEDESMAPEPAVCRMIYFTIPPLAEGYGEAMGIE